MHEQQTIPSLMQDPHTTQTPPQENLFSLKKSIFWSLPVFAVVLMRLPYMGLITMNSDEGLYAAVARAMQNGGLPYKHAWDHAAPGIFNIYWILFAIFGKWNMDAVRIMALFAHTLSALVVSNDMKRRYGSVAGSVAGVLTAIAIGCYLPADVIAALTETFLLPPLLAAAVLLFSWSEGGKSRPILTAILISLAIWFKIHAVHISILLLGGALLARWINGLLKPRDFLIPLKILTYAGLVYLVLILPIILRGGFGSYWDMYIRYNIFYMNVGTYSDGFLFGLYKTVSQWIYPQFVVFILGLIGIWRLAKSTSPMQGRGVMMVCVLIGSFFVALAGGRLFGHYFIPAAAFYGWIAGEGFVFLQGVLREKTFQSKKVITVSGIILLIAGLLFPVHFFHGNAYRMRMYMVQNNIKVGHKFTKLAKKIQEVTNPKDKIWVWGFAPEIYIDSKRDCSSRFINCNYLVGLIPWVNVDPAEDTSDLAVPGSWTKLREDLTSDPPMVIVDAAAANYQFWGKYPLTTRPTLKRFIESNYRRLGEFDKFHLYLRFDDTKAGSEKHDNSILGGK
jgi:hypothetical protein